MINRQITSIETVFNLYRSNLILKAKLDHKINKLRKNELSEAYKKRIRRRSPQKHFDRASIYKSNDSKLSFKAELNHKLN